MWQSILRSYLWETVKQAATEAARPQADAEVESDAKYGDDRAIGVVFALSQESSCFVDRLSDVSTIHAQGFVVHHGWLNNQRVVVVNSGPGSAAAARVTDALIVAHRPKLVISTGFAGGLAKGLEKGHIVIADSVQREQGPRLLIDLTIDRSPQPAMHIGPTVTVDRIVATARGKQQLYEQTGAIAVDMESAAVADTCRTYATPFMAIRIVSDSVQDELPREVSRLINKPTRVRQIGFALGAMLQRPSLAKDLLALKQSALDLSERLAKFLDDMLGQIPAPSD
jgi:adenosylhomocysteine nucleosidase